MGRIRFTAIVLVAVVLAGKWSVDRFAVATRAGRLQGTWEVTSAHRDGIADPSHVGSQMTFEGNQVTLQSWLATWGLDNTLSQWSVIAGEGTTTTYSLVQLDEAETHQQLEASARG